MSELPPQQQPLQMPQDSRPIKKFADFRLSARTLKGLSMAGFVKPTDIQRLAIPPALAGSDIVASAKTGSGKTLAFVLPALELLHREHWCRDLGLGVLIVSPTRELAYQIFRELKRVGVKHQFSLGLVTGGYHDVKEQGARVGRMNILVATPGRLVQHLSERPDLSTDNLRLLVLDEADRILQLGFKAELDALLDYLPAGRQTLLFSATQTRSVQDLARLQMRQPVCQVDASRLSTTATPDGLRQGFVRCQSVADKPRYLWQFITGNRQRKSIAFFATCKQVRFYNELLLKLRPGVRVLPLHGGMTQRRRTAVYDEFVRVKHAVMLCTDLAARGLDFPDVDCVLQVDCPPDLRTYVHRVGRTARLTRTGRAVLLLLDWEADTLPGLLAGLRPPVQLEPVKLRLPVKWDIVGKIAGLVAADGELRGMAERAVRTYLKTYACFAELKQVFQAQRLDLLELARSYGLARVPRLPKPVLAKVRLPGASGSDELLLGDNDDEDDSASGDAAANDADSEVDDFLIAKSESELAGGTAPAKEGKPHKKKNNNLQVAPVEPADLPDEDEPSSSSKRKKPTLTKARLAKRILSKGIRPFTRVLFNEDGDVIADPRLPAAVSLADDNAGGSGGLAIDDAKRHLAEEDAVDKRLYREMVQRRHREAKAKAKARRLAEKAAGGGRGGPFAKRRRLQAEDDEDDDDDDDEGSGSSSGEKEHEQEAEEFEGEDVEDAD